MERHEPKNKELLKQQEVERENLARRNAMNAEKEAAGLRRLDALEKDVACLKADINCIMEMITKNETI
mgnify:CR=1 FL=1